MSRRVLLLSWVASVLVAACMTFVVSGPAGAVGGPGCVLSGISGTFEVGNASTFTLACTGVGSFYELDMQMTDDAGAPLFVTVYSGSYYLSSGTGALCDFSTTFTYTGAVWVNYGAGACGVAYLSLSSGSIDSNGTIDTLDTFNTGGSYAGAFTYPSMPSGGVCSGSVSGHESTPGVYVVDSASIVCSGFSATGSLVLGVDTGVVDSLSNDVQAEILVSSNGYSCGGPPSSDFIGGVSFGVSPLVQDCGNLSALNYSVSFTPCCSGSYQFEGVSGDSFGLDSSFVSASFTALAGGPAPPLASSIVAFGSSFAATAGGVVLPFLISFFGLVVLLAIIMFWRRSVRGR